MSRFWSNGIGPLVLQNLRFGGPESVRSAMLRAGAAQYPAPSTPDSREAAKRELALKRDMENNETVIVMLTLCGHRFKTIQELFDCGHTAVAKRLHAGGLGAGRRGRRARGDILAIRAPRCRGSRSPHPVA